MFSVCSYVCMYGWILPTHLVCSVRQNAAMLLPAASRGRKHSFCSSVPNINSVWQKKWLHHRMQCSNTILSTPYVDGWFQRICFQSDIGNNKKTLWKFCCHLRYIWFLLVFVILTFIPKAWWVANIVAMEPSNAVLSHIFTYCFAPKSIPPVRE